MLFVFVFGLLKYCLNVVYIVYFRYVVLDVVWLSPACCINVVWMLFGWCLHDVWIVVECYLDVGWMMLWNIQKSTQVKSLRINPDFGHSKLGLALALAFAFALAFIIDIHICIDIDIGNRHTHCRGIGL